MKIKCPHCGQRYEVEQENANQIVTCVSCNQEFIVKISLQTENIAIAPQPEQPPVQKQNVYSQTQQNNFNPASIEQQNAGSSLKSLTCEMCGSTDMIKQNGVFVCQSCGTKYSLEEAKKMMIDGTVNVSGTVRVDMSEKLKNLYTIARRAKDDKNTEKAAKYYDLILQEDSDSWEACFYATYYQAMSCTIGQISSAASLFKNNFKSVVDLIEKQNYNECTKSDIYSDLTDEVLDIAHMFVMTSKDNFYEFHSREDFVSRMYNSIAICCEWGYLIEEQYFQEACSSWKYAISSYILLLEWHKENWDEDTHLIKKLAEKIRKNDPKYQYTLPEKPEEPTKPIGCWPLFVWAFFFLVMGVLILSSCG